MPESPISLNLAFIVHRLLTNPRGWRVEDLMSRLKIARRTYRKYRHILMEEFTPFRRAGSSMVGEVQENDSLYLRILDIEESAITDKDFLSRVAALHLAQQMFQFLRKTDVAKAMSVLVNEFKQRLHDRQFVLRHVMGNVDRLFYQVPDAPKDYSNKQEVLQGLLQALVFTKVIRVSYSSASKDELQLVLEPYALVTYRSAIYIMARCPPHEDVRTYAVDRMKKVSVLNERFAYPSRQQFDPATYTEGCFGIFREEEHEPYQVELIFANRRWLKMNLTERSWHPSQIFEELDDGRLRMKFEVRSMIEVWPWIRSFGDDVEVISPPLEDMSKIKDAQQDSQKDDH